MRPIIVGTDFSQGSYIAIELAIDVANKLETDIKLLWAKREKLLIDEDYQKTMIRLAESKLEELCNKYQPLLKHGHMRWEICDGKVSNIMARQARNENAPLIIIGTNGASGFEKYWMGSTAVRIVQEAPIPVLTIREGYNFHKELERIVVPIRVNNNSRQKVPPAISMAKIFGAEIHFVGLYDSDQLLPQLKTYLKQSCDFCAQEGIAYQSTIERYKDYADTLLDYCDTVKADMVVINTEQDRIISQLFLGTNAQQIVHRSQIPVLCIHPSDIINIASRI